MNTIVKITGILSWFNLAVGSMLILGGLFVGLASGSMVNVLTIAVIASAIVLHSYAALQLRKSILYPVIPLSNQTPVGIRFIGYVALFFGLLDMVQSIIMLQDTREFVQQIKLPAGSPPIDLSQLIHAVSLFSILFSVSIIMNVMMNFRLLKWYMAETKE